MRERKTLARQPDACAASAPMAGGNMAMEVRDEQKEEEEKKGGGGRTANPSGFALACGRRAEENKKERRRTG